MLDVYCILLILSSGSAFWNYRFDLDAKTISPYKWVNFYLVLLLYTALALSDDLVFGARIWNVVFKDVCDKPLSSLELSVILRWAILGGHPFSKMFSCSSDWCRYRAIYCGSWMEFARSVCQMTVSVLSCYIFCRYRVTIDFIRVLMSTAYM